MTPSQAPQLIDESIQDKDFKLFHKNIGDAVIILGASKH
jgi:hypothetical protein